MVEKVDTLDLKSDGGVAIWVQVSSVVWWSVGCNGFAFYGSMVKNGVNDYNVSRDIIKFCGINFSFIWD